MPSKKPTASVETKQKKEKKEKKAVSVQAGKSAYDFLFAFQGERISIPRNGSGKSDKGKEYGYATLDDVIAITRDPLQKHGLMYTQVIMQNAANETMLKTSLVAVNATAEPKSIETSIPIGKPSSAQDMGSRITYMRRYALVPILGLSIEEDTDAVPAEMREQPVPKVIIEKVPGPVTESTVRQDVEEQSPAVSDPKEAAGVPTKESVHASGSPQERLQVNIDAIRAVPVRSETYAKASNVIRACGNEEALEVIRLRIESHELLTDAEKKELFEEAALKADQISGTVRI